MTDRIHQRFEQAAELVTLSASHLAARLRQAADLIVGSYRRGGGMLLLGNGGSAADAQHIACEMVGRFLKERPGYRAIALSSDPSVVTCIANDYDYASVFARQVQALGRAGDVVVGLSTSGNSANVVDALAQARQMGMATIAFTGQGGGRCAAVADVLLDVPSKGPSCRIQEAHVVCYHVLCELIEEALTQDAR